jgi:hypothetical protein
LGVEVLTGEIVGVKHLLRNVFAVDTHMLKYFISEQRNKSFKSPVQ